MEWKCWLFIRSKIQFFESKSQPNQSDNPISRVVYQIKDTIFWKQITTISRPLFPVIQLFIRSKIQFFESKSQHLRSHSACRLCCLSDQRYNFLKANHNATKFVLQLIFVVYQIKDTIFWKQITTIKTPYNIRYSCLSDQRYNFLKANHNWRTLLRPKTEVVYQIKDTIFWKQITTLIQRNNFPAELFIRSKIQFFESKSQLIYNNRHGISSCLSDQRYNFLKANHNWLHLLLARGSVVYQIKDTIFWKQITTRAV